MWDVIKYVAVGMLACIGIVECIRAEKVDQENLELYTENKRLKTELKAYQSAVGPFEEFETTER